jgi:hypothetical protein
MRSAAAVREISEISSSEGGEGILYDFICFLPGLPIFLPTGQASRLCQHSEQFWTDGHMTPFSL